MVCVYANRNALLGASDSGRGEDGIAHAVKQLFVIGDSGSKISEGFSPCFFLPVEAPVPVNVPGERRAGHAA